MSLLGRLFCVCAIGVAGALATSAAAVAASGTLYVNVATGNDLNTCTTPAAPCKTIAAGVEKAEAAPEDETATIEVAAGVYKELVTLKSSASGITINGAGSGLGGTEIEGPESVGSPTVMLSAPGSAIALSNLSIVNDQKGNTGKGLQAAATATLTNVVVTMEEPVNTPGIEASAVGGSLTMHGGGVTMEAGTEGTALLGAPGATLTVDGASIVVASGSKAGGIGTQFAPAAITGTVVNVASAVSERPAVAFDGGAVSLVEDTIKHNGAAFNSTAIQSLFGSLSARGVSVTMTNPASKANAVVEAVETATYERLAVGGAWAGPAFFAEGGNVTFADSSLVEAPGTTQPALAYIAGSETPGLVIRRSVVHAAPTAIGALFTANANVTLDSSEVLGGHTAILDEVVSGKTKTVTVAGSTVDAANLGVADGGGATAMTVLAGKGNSIVNAAIEGSIVLEPQVSLLIPGGHSATVACSSSDVPNQVQLATASEGSIQCATGAAGNTHTEPALLFATPVSSYQLNPAASAVDSVPASAVALPFGLTPSSTDLAGSPRVVDGNGDCFAVQDRGALELQGHAASCPAIPSPATTPFAQPAPAPAAKPAITGLTISPAAFRAAPRGATIAAVGKSRYGAGVSYHDSAAATTTFTVLAQRGGRRQGGVCRRPGARNGHGARCTLYLPVGSFTHIDKAGANGFRFSGRVHNRKLTAGSYRLQAVPRSAAATGAAATAAFKIK